jgi:hypothetical protein
MFDHSSKIPITGDPLTDILRGLRLDGVEYGHGIEGALGHPVPGSSSSTVSLHRSQKLLVVAAVRRVGGTQGRRCRAAAAWRSTCPGERTGRQGLADPRLRGRRGRKDVYFMSNEEMCGKDCRPERFILRPHVFQSRRLALCSA